uniref:Uncharacterized protein n=1 Tax=Eptatretus burgeri TaxID=7764 RepID=A0A8C4QN89_EPTBU
MIHLQQDHDDGPGEGGPGEPKEEYRMVMMKKLVQRYIDMARSEFEENKRKDLGYRIGEVKKVLGRMQADLKNIRKTLNPGSSIESAALFKMAEHHILNSKVASTATAETDPEQVANPSSKPSSKNGSLRVVMHSQQTANEEEVVPPPEKHNENEFPLPDEAGIEPPDVPGYDDLMSDGEHPADEETAENEEKSINSVNASDERSGLAEEAIEEDVNDQVEKNEEKSIHSVNVSDEGSGLAEEAVKEDVNDQVLTAVADDTDIEQVAKVEGDVKMPDTSEGDNVGTQDIEGVGEKAKDVIKPTNDDDGRATDISKVEHDNQKLDYEATPVPPRLAIPKRLAPQPTAEFQTMVSKMMQNRQKAPAPPPPLVLPAPPDLTAPPASPEVQSAESSSEDSPVEETILQEAVKNVCLGDVMRAVASAHGETNVVSGRNNNLSQDAVSVTSSSRKRPAPQPGSFFKNKPSKEFQSLVSKLIENRKPSAEDAKKEISEGNSSKKDSIEVVSETTQAAEITSREFDKQ